MLSELDRAQRRSISISVSWTHRQSLSCYFFFSPAHCYMNMPFGLIDWIPLSSMWFLDFSYRQNVSGSWLGLLVPCRVHGKSWLLISLKFYIYINISNGKSVQQSPFSHGTQHLSHSALDTGTRQDIFHSTEILWRLRPMVKLLVLSLSVKAAIKGNVKNIVDGNVRDIVDGNIYFLKPCITWLSACLDYFTRH